MLHRNWWWLEIFLSPNDTRSLGGYMATGSWEEAWWLNWTRKNGVSEDLAWIQLSIECEYKEFDQLCRIFQNDTLFWWIFSNEWLEYAIHCIMYILFRVLKDLMTEFNTASDELINVLSPIAEKNRDTKLGPLMHKTTLDVIGKVSERIKRWVNGFVIRCGMQFCVIISMLASYLGIFCLFFWNWIYAILIISVFRRSSYLFLQLLHLDLVFLIYKYMYFSCFFKWRYYN